VSSRNPAKTKDHKIVWQQYKPGEVWLFNSFYYHNVYNMGTADRDHIMMYTPLTDEKYLNILAQAVENYSGPLIQEDLS
jgi:ABC-type lipoprotein release transport system permease subunit